MTEKPELDRACHLMSRIAEDPGKAKPQSAGSGFLDRFSQSSQIEVHLDAECGYDSSCKYVRPLLKSLWVAGVQDNNVCFARIRSFGLTYHITASQNLVVWR